MDFSKIRMVLVETSHPGNIGACARAMKNMGFSSLYLVNPKQFPHYQAIEMSAGAEDILEKAVVVETLAEALADCQIVMMTSARARNIALTGATPAQAAEWVAGKYASQSVAMVFGREKSGLTNEELLLGHHHIVIPANPEYASLNLSQALQIMSYELRIKALNPEAHSSMVSDELASVEAIERFYEHLAEVLKKIDFLKEAAPRRLMQRLRRLFGRTQLEKMEVDLLRGMLSRIEYALKSTEKPHE